MKRTSRNISKEELEIRNMKKKTRKRTRKFEVDGVVVTTTTSKVIYGDEDSSHGYNDQIFRKQELRELKMLQKQEQKQFQDLSFKAVISKEQQDKKFEQERMTLIKQYEADLDTMVKQQRQAVERAETQQEADLRMTSKKIRLEQVITTLKICIYFMIDFFIYNLGARIKRIQRRSKTRITTFKARSRFKA